MRGLRAAQRTAGGALVQRAARQPPLQRCASASSASSSTSTSTSGGGDGTAASDAATRAAMEAALACILPRYFERSPTAARLVQRTLPALGASGAPAHDHLAFRSFGAPGLGLAALAGFFGALGYTRREAIAFPRKHLTATWLSPPPGLYEALPRIFISEVAPAALSPAAAAVVGRAAADAAGLSAAQLAACVLGGEAPWGPPTAAEYETLLAESEYAAWCAPHVFMFFVFNSAVHLAATTSSAAERPADLSTPPL
jgi:hypothetical protein